MLAPPWADSLEQKWLDDGSEGYFSRLIGWNPCWLKVGS